MTDHRRRRADLPESEGAAPPSPEDPPESSKKRSKRTASDFFRRFRQPLVGLGIIGATAPVISSKEAEAETPKHTDRDETDQPAREGANLEESIAGRIAETRGDKDRDDAVGYAVGRYNIDRDLAEAIYDRATEAGIEPKLAYGLVKTESAFRHNAISHVGARGLTQVMPRTAKWLQPGTNADDLYDRHTNLSLGFKYLNQLIDKYNGDVKLALLAYNRGPGTVDKILKRGGNPDNGYARKVMDG